MTLTSEELRERLNYDPETGVFTRRVDVKAGKGAIRYRAGDVAGSKDKYGYTITHVAGKKYFAHRLAWLYVFGEWPSQHIDHINSEKSDNRIANLRLASHTQNMQNRVVQRNSSTGLKGIYLHKKNNKWHARITVNGAVKSLGYFHSQHEAHEAYAKAAKEHFGEFWRAA